MIKKVLSTSKGFVDNQINENHLRAIRGGWCSTGSQSGGHDFIDDQCHTYYEDCSSKPDDNCPEC